MKDSIFETLPEIESMKSEISFLKQKLDNLEQYSRKNCLVFAWIPEPRDAQNKINTYILAGTNYNSLDEFAICNSHRLGPKTRPDQECVSPLEILSWNSFDAQI